MKTNEMNKHLTAMMNEGFYHPKYQQGHKIWCTEWEIRTYSYEECCLLGARAMNNIFHRLNKENECSLDLVELTSKPTEYGTEMTQFNIGCDNSFIVTFEVMNSCDCVELRMTTWKGFIDDKDNDETVLAEIEMIDEFVAQEMEREEND